MTRNQRKMVNSQEITNSNSKENATKRSNKNNQKEQKHGNNNPNDSIVKQEAGKIDESQYHNITSDPKQLKKSKNKRLKRTNCFERDREKGGGVDELGEDDEEEDDQCEEKQQAKESLKDEDAHTMQIVPYLQPERMTIKDIINNNRAGVPAKSAVINSMNKKSEKR